MKENIEGRKQKWPPGEEKRALLFLCKTCIEENLSKTIEGYHRAKEEGIEVNIEKMKEKAIEESKRKIEIIEIILNMKKEEITNLSYPASLIGLNLIIECESSLKKELPRLVEEENLLSARDILNAIEALREIRKEFGKNIFKVNSYQSPPFYLIKKGENISENIPEEEGPRDTVEKWEIEVRKMIDTIPSEIIENAYKEIFAKVKKT